jgi:hypothetical protein
VVSSSLEDDAVGNGLSRGDQSNLLTPEEVPGSPEVVIALCITTIREDRKMLLHMS